MTDAKVFIVTGAAGNVGAALCRVLAAQGARVAGMDRVAAARTVRDGDGVAEWIEAADLTDPAIAEAAVATAVAKLGRLDGVVNTVGGFAMGALADSGPDMWTQLYRINVLTTLNLFRAAIPQLRAAGGGGMVAVGAGAALRAPSGMAAYAAAKSGVLRLVESTADELKRERIRVNAVLPGTIDTPQNRAAMPDADPALWTAPDEVAHVIAFLLSDAASGVTGAAVAVPGRA